MARLIAAFVRLCCREAIINSLDEITLHCQFECVGYFRSQRPIIARRLNGHPLFDFGRETNFHLKMRFNHPTNLVSVLVCYR